MSATIARDQFEENLRLFADSKSEPEKFNLYGGLMNIAIELQAIRSDLANLRQAVDRLSR